MEYWNHQPATGNGPRNNLHQPHAQSEKSGRRMDDMVNCIQHYSLRWNNHRSNLLIVFEHLFQTESFTDVTLACDGTSIKCHKMVLAACSSYFEQLFLDNDCRHPIVIIKDIREEEIRTILEYMYKGEVNVAQDQLAGLLKAAEALKVKGLVEENNQRVQVMPTPQHRQSPYQSHSAPHSAPEYHPSASSHPKSNSLPPKFVSTDSIYESPYNSSASSSALPERNALPFPIWGSNKLSVSPPVQHGPSSATISHHATNNICNNIYENSQSEPVPLKKKKYHNVTKDTPILRTVLGHTSHQPNPEPPQHKSLNYTMTNSLSNGPLEINDKGSMDSPDHFMDETIRSVESDKVQEDNHSFNLDSDDKHAGLATYVPTQKPEWKRYKQYTRNDIMAAIDAVRGGMSALQAARKYGVPSRTLYDKVKKLGITTNRPYRKGSFPMSPYQGLNQKMDDNSGFSPEEPLDISTTGNNINHNHIHGHEGDSDKVDSDPGSGSGSGSGIKQELSPPIDEKDDSNHGIEEHAEIVSRNCSSTSPRDRDPSENEDMRSGSD